MNNLPQPLLEPLNKLLAYKQRTGLQSALAKRMCFSEDTQIMTQSGTKPITKIELGELVYSINPTTLKTELKPIIGIRKYPYNDKLIYLENKRHNFLITPEHRMLLKKDTKKNYEFIEANSIVNSTTSRWSFPPYTPIESKHQVNFNLWDYLNIDTIAHIKPNKKWSSTFEKDKQFRYIGNSSGYHTPAKNIKDPTKLEQDKDCRIFIKNARRSHDLPWQFATNDWLELLGWYISEGHIEITKKHNSRVIGITNKYHITKICELLGRMKLPYNVYQGKNASRIRIPHHAIFNYCLDNCGTHAETKRIPDELFTLCHCHLEHLFETLMLGDGSLAKKKQMAKYSTISKQLAKDFQRLCLHLGYKTRIDFENSKSPIYRVFIYSTRRQSIIKHQSIRSQSYNRDVWGITVADNFTILAGRNNKFEFVGQSVGLYGKFGEERKREFGPYFNPVWFCEISTRVRLQVAEYLYSNGIGPGDNEGYKHLIHISIDGVILDCPVEEIK